MKPWLNMLRGYALGERLRLALSSRLTTSNGRVDGREILGILRFDLQQLLAFLVREVSVLPFTLPPRPVPWPIVPVVGRQYDRPGPLVLHLVQYALHDMLDLRPGKRGASVPVGGLEDTTAPQHDEVISALHPQDVGAHGGLARCVEEPRLQVLILRSGELPLRHALTAVDIDLWPHMANRCMTTGRKVLQTM